MKQKELNPKDYVLPTRTNEAGAVVPKNTGWHNIKTLRPMRNVTDVTYNTVINKLHGRRKKP